MAHANASITASHKTHTTSVISPTPASVKGASATGAQPKPGYVVSNGAVTTTVPVRVTVTMWIGANAR